MTLPLLLHSNQVKSTTCDLLLRAVHVLRFVIMHLYGNTINGKIHLQWPGGTSWTLVELQLRVLQGHEHFLQVGILSF